MGRCYECGLDYQDPGWIEAIIPDKIWNEISPTGNQAGLLCIICISRRLVEKGYKKVPVWLTGTEPLRPAGSDPSDDEASLFILRNFKPTDITNKEKKMRAGRFGLMGVRGDGMLFTPSGAMLFKVPMWLAIIIQKIQHRFSRYL